MERKIIFKVVVLIFIGILISPKCELKAQQNFTCGNNLIDSRDGQSYKTVQIGAQCWMQQNLNVGTEIIGGTTMTNNGKIQKYCYNDVASNCTTYGGLYQWNEAMNFSTTAGAQGICPNGWHVPSDFEYKILEIFLGMPQCTADSTPWRDKGFVPILAAGGSSGFDFLYNGVWDSNEEDVFKNLGTYGYLLSSTQYNATMAWGREISNQYNVNFYQDDRDHGLKTLGCGVRCLLNYNCDLNIYNVTGSGSYCLNGNNNGVNGLEVGLDGSDAGVSYRLYKNGICTGESLTGTGFPISFGILPAGTYIVSALDISTGCGNNMNDSAVVKVNPVPISYNVNGGGSYCADGAGVAIGLSGSQIGVQYQLQLNDTSLGSPLAGTGSSMSFGLHTGVGTYTVLATYGTSDCTSNMSGNAVISINSLPSVNVSSISICSGSSGILTANATGVNYVWQNGATTQSIKVTSLGQYCVTVTDNNKCSNSSCGNVSVNPLPAVTVPNISICYGSVGILTAIATGVNYVWQSGATSQSINVTLSGQYCVTVTDINKCTNLACGNVTVNSLPAVIIPNISICSGSSGILTANATGVNYSWQNGVTTQSLNVNSSGQYCVTVTDNNNCINSSCGNVTINQLPVVTVPSLSICSGSSGKLTANATGVSYLWQDGETSQSILVKTSGQYCVTVTNDSKCYCSACGNVTFNSMPIITSQPINQCTTDNNGSGVFSVTATNALSYQWQVNNVNLQGATTNILTLLQVTKSMCNNKYIVIVSNNCGSVKSLAATLNVVTIPTSLASVPSYCSSLLSWNSICGVVVYEVEYWTNSSNHLTDYVLNPFVNLTNLKSAKLYYWHVRAYMINGCSMTGGWSDIETFTTLTNTCNCNCGIPSRLISDDNSSDISLYPNPTTGTVNITLPNSESKLSLSIYNITGRKVYEENELTGNSIKQIDMSANSKGVYLLNIRNNEFNKTFKLILQ